MTSLLRLAIGKTLCYDEENRSGSSKSKTQRELYRETLTIAYSNEKSMKLVAVLEKAQHSSSLVPQPENHEYS